MPEWVRITLQNLIARDKATTDLQSAQQDVKAQYVERAEHDRIVADLTAQLTAATAAPPPPAAPPVTIVDRSWAYDQTRHALGSSPAATPAPNPAPVPAPPPVPPAAPKPCRCGGALGSSCPICHGTRVVP